MKITKEIIIRPQDVIIGDWMLYNGMPRCVCAVNEGCLMLKENNCDCNRAIVSYEDVRPIPISPDYMTMFGFTKCEADGWLFDEACWRFKSDEVEDPEARELCVSWKADDDDHSRTYRTTCRGYGDQPFFHFDAISDIQHFFYNDSHCVLPIKPNI